MYISLLGPMCGLIYIHKPPGAHIRLLGHVPSGAHIHKPYWAPPYMAHTHIYIHTPSPAHTRAHIHAYIHTLLLPSKYAFSWLLYIHTWRNVVGLWPMFDVLRAYVHTYIHMHPDTHFAIRHVCTYISLHAHIHICVCVCEATCVALTTFGIPTRAYGHS